MFVKRIINVPVPRGLAFRVTIVDMRKQQRKRQPQRKYPAAVKLGSDATDPDERSEAAARMARRLATVRGAEWRRDRAIRAANARWKRQRQTSAA